MAKAYSWSRRVFRHRARLFRPPGSVQAHLVENKNKQQQQQISHRPSRQLVNIPETSFPLA